MSRKSQAATEFLVTYGWALLVVLLVISFLGYFFIDPSIFKPDMCTLQHPFNCREFEVTHDRIMLKIVNPGRAIKDIQSEVICTPDYANSANLPFVDIGDTFELIFPGYHGKTADCDIDIIYVPADSTYKRRATGTIRWANVRGSYSAVHEEHPPEDLCMNDVLDFGEVGTISGQPGDWQSGPWPSDCGSSESGCPLCENHRTCTRNSDCASNCCEKWSEVCVDYSGASPFASKIPFECLD